ncbi:TlpA family protein disulfide reductase [Pedobacter nyackensis]|uniref:Cytochrome oxidase Cu insertion factor, SCO1/SenC/PrrC family n=1 Tax=Pedobacter nyackensis TaxID=475255 RepID=A0A1W2DWM7_9SPHI|nr:TlpA disulfide reductase family protein [Pedobacter nyackensis]SMD01328.1 Cytochrome oxidase Cu insertion factor, SCO1/SenC/PrrC family [Pedobacter nyackensis]
MKTKILALLMTTAITNIEAQSIKDQERSVDAPYSIKLEILEKNHSSAVPTKLSLEVYEFFSAYGIKANQSIVEQDIRGKKLTKSLAIPSAVSFLQIRYKFGKSYGKFFGGQRAYLIEDGDDFTCELYPDSVWFHGKGALKMNLQTQLFKLLIKYEDRKTDIFNPNYFEDEMRLFNRINNEQIELLTRYKGLVSDKVYNYLYHQCTGSENFRMLAIVRNTVLSNLPESSGRAMAFYSKHIAGARFENLSDSVHISSTFMDFLYLKEKFDFELISTDTAHINKIGAITLFSNIKKKYKGNIRSRLFVIGFSDLAKRYSDVLGYLDTAIHSSKNTAYFNLLQKLSKSLTNGQMAYPFELPDSSGKLLKLEDLKGKVVIMDFWFTGCIACKVLAKQMIPILKHFKGKDVAFVSVNVDHAKETWLKSLRKGEYTHEGNFDVFTDGLGYGHPILKHYNFNSYPRLIIIGPDGRLISATPPRPVDDQHLKDLMKLIESNLL